jgi:LPS-assembly protein
LKTKGEFSLGSYWNWGWDATLESDDTFRRFYRLDSIYATDRISQLYLVGQSDRNYFSANMYHFGGLTRDDYDGSDSIVHPVIDYNYVYDRPVAGGELSFDINALSLSRDTDDGLASFAPTKNTNRIVSEVKWRRTLTDPLGQRITPFFRARGDVYQIAEFTDLGDERGDDELLTRQLVTGGIDYRYPFVKANETATHVVEPIGQIIARPSTTKSTDVPNEDAQSLIFDDTLLFDIDKFSGYDRIETGTRANVGVQYTMQTNDGISLRLLGGQSYQIAGDNPFRRDTGLDSDRSDYVFGGYVDIRNYFRLVSQVRLNESDLSVERQDLKLSANAGPIYGAVSYVSAQAQPELGYDEDREEVAAFAALQLDDKWTVFGDIRYDLASNDIIRDSIGIQYSDECFTISVTYAQTFIEYDDIEPDESVMLRVGLKYLGQEVGASSIGALSPEASIVK